MQQKKEVGNLLAESFKELVLEKPVEKITIKEITDRAGVIRVTFYNHFQDKYELLEWICREEIVSPIRMLLWNDMTVEAMTFMFTSILKNKEFYRHAARLEGQNSFGDIVKRCFSEVIVDYLSEHAKNGKKKYSWLTPQRVGDFYAQALAYILITWIESGMQESPEEMVAMYQYVTSHSMMDLPDEL